MNDIRDTGFGLGDSLPPMYNGQYLDDHRRQSDVHSHIHHVATPAANHTTIDRGSHHIHSTHSNLNMISAIDHSNPSRNTNPPYREYYRNIPQPRQERVLSRSSIIHENSVHSHSHIIQLYRPTDGPSESYI